MLLSILDGGNWKLFRSVDIGLTWSQIASWGTSDALYGIAHAREMFFLNEYISYDGGQTVAKTSYSGGENLLPEDVVVMIYLDDYERLVMGALGNLYYSDWLEAGAGIVEQGTNSNGEYVRFSNGLQLARGSGTMPNPLTISNNAIGVQGWSFYFGAVAVTFAAAFSSAPDIVLGPIATLLAGRSTAPTTTGATLTGITSTSIGGQTYQYLTIGRWK